MKINFEETPRNAINFGSCMSGCWKQRRTHSEEQKFVAFLVVLALRRLLVRIPFIGADICYIFNVLVNLNFFIGEDKNLEDVCIIQ